MKYFRRISIKNKLILSSLIFSLPIAILLFLTVQGINSDIDFSTLEIYGNKYQKPLMTILKAMPGAVGGAMYEDRSNEESAVSLVGSGLKGLAAMDAEYGTALQFTPDGLNSRNRSNLALDKVEARWRTVSGDAGNADGFMDFSEVVAGVIAHAGDTSNLILDPDLDSYYLMDVTLLGIPGAYKNLIRTAKEAAVVAKAENPSEDQIILLHVLAHKIQDDQDRIAGSIQVALSEDDNFYGHYAPMHRAIPKALDAYEKANQALLAKLGELIRGDGKADVPGALAAASGQAAALWSVTSQELDALLNIRVDSYRSDRLRALVMVSVNLLLALAVVVFSGRSIVQSLRELAAYAQEVENGNLDARADGTFSQTLGILRDSIQTMVDNLKEQMRSAHAKSEEAMQAKAEAEAALNAVSEQEAEAKKQADQLAALGQEINRVAERVASASEELFASAEEQARGASNQKEQSDQVATAMEEMTQTVIEVAGNAASTSQAAQESANTAQNGVDSVREAVETINKVSASTGELESVLIDLDKQAEEIGRIIGVINEIADQTNLLALNAAIEAARAGEQGRGFAVVADEVRKLAEKTMVATKEVESAVGQIQTGSQHAVRSMGLTKSQVEASTQASSRTAEYIGEIMENIEDINMRVSQIATAAEEQSAAAEEINSSVEDIAVIAREAEDGAVQSAEATRDLAKLAQELLDLSMRFKQDKMDTGKLRKSSGEMRGILPKLAQQFVRETYGEAVYAKVQKEMGHPTFLPATGYPDQVMRQMVELVSQATGKRVEDIFDKLGTSTLNGFQKMYRRYFKGDNLKEFLLAMNDIHANLTKDNPGITPPRFEYEDRGKKLVMTYVSSRGYGEYFLGIVKAAAAFFHEKVTVEAVRKGAGRTQATITWK